MLKFRFNNEDIRKIVQKLNITNHAKQRVKERLGITKVKELKEKINQSNLGWRVDDIIYIAINQERCIIVKDLEDKFSLLTVLGTSNKGITAETKIPNGTYEQKTKAQPTKLKYLKFGG